MGMDNNNGQMEQNMKDSGKIIKLMDKELSGMFMVTNTKANGKEIKLTVSASTLI
mgnify:CR=1 FL=1